MARMWKPFFSNCSMMSPIAFLATASGFTMVKVRCRVFIVGRRSFVVRFYLSRDATVSNPIADCHPERSEGSWSLPAPPRLLLPADTTIHRFARNDNPSLNFHSERRHQRLPNVRWRFCHADPGRFHGFDFLRSRAFAAGDDRSGVAHAASGRSSLPGDESNHWLLHL